MGPGCPNKSFGKRFKTGFTATEGTRLPSGHELGGAHRALVGQRADLALALMGGLAGVIAPRLPANLLWKPAEQRAAPTGHFGWNWRESPNETEVNQSERVELQDRGEPSVLGGPSKRPKANVVLFEAFRRAQTPHR